MVKFAPVQLGNPPPLGTPSSSYFYRKGLRNQIPSSTPRYEGEDKDLRATKWTNTKEEASFVHLLVNEVHNGNKHKTFTKKAWENIELGFYKKTGKKNILRRLKNKYATLKSRYFEFNKLLKEPGFSWNPTTCQAVASNADWVASMKTNKRARVFQVKGCPLYNELGIIFGDPIAGCQNATPPTLCSLDSEVKCGTENDSTKSSRSNSAKVIVDVEEPHANATLHTGDFKQQSLPSVVDLTKSGTDVAAATTTPIVGSQLCKATDQIPLPYAAIKRKRASEFTNSSHGEHQITLLPHDGEHQIPLNHDELKSLSTTDFSITGCVKCLESIQGIDCRTYVKAIKLFKDVDWREMFMAMSAERRRDWLASLE